jgi:tripeptidyl-peptidase-1
MGRLFVCFAWFCLFKNVYALHSYPGDSPYVLVVGGTIGAENSQTETATDSCIAGGSITSGGGFAAFGQQPSWQSQAVSTYVTTTTNNDHFPLAYDQNANPPSQRRGFPDISAAAESYPIIVGGSIALLSGTSASTPLVASMLSLINGMRVQHGSPTLGFVTPAIYQMGYANQNMYFNDIIAGNNACGRGGDSTKNCAAAQYGFSAEVGWDATSGW